MVLLKRIEAAERLRLSLGSLDLLIKRGALVPVRMGRQVLIPEEQVASLMKKGTGRIWPEKVDGRTTRKLA